MSSLTLPQSGGLVNGELFERQMLAHPTAESAFSSLPTPHAGLGERGRDGIIKNPKGQQDLQHTLAHLLPTPAVMDMGSNYTPEQWQAWKDKQRAAHNNGNGHGASLTQEALTMLPTPRSRLEGNQHYKGRNKNNLEDVAELFGESTPQPSPDGKLF
jgi:hypothetical protein